MFDYRQFYRRKLPHVHSPGASLFVTFRLIGSVPKSVLREWQLERKSIDNTVEKFGRERTANGLPAEDAYRERLLQFHRTWFLRYEEVLHQAATGPVWLKNPGIAKIVADALEYHNQRSYGLHAYSVMSNHAHVLFTPILNEGSLTRKPDANKPEFESFDPTLAVIMKSIKGYSAREANKLLGRKGAFWEAESYDREVRDSREFWRTVRYILNNPVKARIVNDWKEYPFNWLADELRSKL